MQNQDKNNQKKETPKQQQAGENPLKKVETSAPLTALKYNYDQSKKETRTDEGQGN
jgi:hypothetical protein